MFKKSTISSRVGNLESKRKISSPISKTSNSKVWASLNSKRDKKPKDISKHSDPKLLIDMISESGDSTSRWSKAVNVKAGGKKVMAFDESTVQVNDTSKIHNQLLRTKRGVVIMHSLEQEALSLQDNEKPKMLPISRIDAVDIFNSLGLSEKQISGLETFGFDLSNLLPQQRRQRIWGSRNHNKSGMASSLENGNSEELPIPDSFRLHGATCYVCKSREQVAYGMGLIFHQNPLVIAVELERDPTRSIQIATSDIVLWVPGSQIARALSVLFRDTQVIKIGMNIEEKLKAIWCELQIESRLFLELSDLLQLWNDGVLRRFDLKKMAVAMGYLEPRSDESQARLHPATVSVLMANYVFWGMVERQCMTHGRIGLDLINSLCTHVPISIVCDEEQNLKKQHRYISDHHGEIRTSRMSISSGLEEDAEDIKM